MSEPVGPAALILLAIPAICLRIAVRILYGRQRSAAPDAMRMLLFMASTLMWSIAVAGLLLGVAIVWLIFIPLPIAAIIVLFMVLDRTRHAEHRALIWALATAANRQIPLAEAARAYADETTGDTGTRAMALARALERGEPLSTAARSARLKMGSAMRLAVRLGERLGLLGPAMRQQLDDSHQIDAALRDVIVRFFYLVNVILVMIFICTFVMLMIIPVFERMFQDFGLKLPAMTLLVIEASNWFVSRGWFLVGPLFAVLTPFLMFASALYYLGWFPRNFPAWWWLFRRYDGALVMRGLALAVRRGVPMPQALRLVAESYPLSIIALRVRTAAERVEAGREWTHSLRQTGLIGASDAALLAAAQRAGNLEWALEEAANSALRRQAYLVHGLLQLLFPAAILTVGTFVGIFVIGLFLPLIALIQGLI